MNWPENWWEELYDAPFEAVMRQARSDEEMNRIAEFLVDALDLEAGDRVFDQCCGTGRISRAMGARGLRVVGVDQSASSIDTARTEAAEDAAQLDFTVADAFEWTPPEPCDAAYNWWTAFANTPSDNRNSQMLERAFEALRPGGYFALDYFNLPTLFGDFQPTRAASVETEQGTVTLIERNWLDLSEGALRASWTFIWPDGSRDVRRGYIRLYQPHDVMRMMRAVGFDNLTAYGGPDGSRLSRESPRCVVVGRRPR